MRVRANLAQGVFRFFITDDNFARNRNWEAIFDRLIEMREREGLGLQFIIQVDMLCHRIPNFVEKAARAGCKRVFIGLENINPDNLLQAKKKQNRVHEYRQMFLAWRAQRVITYAGYILGLPGDTPERIAHDIRAVQRELPVDLLEFFILTPLPGSADHQQLHKNGVWMDPDMNKYDLEHVTTGHPVMTAAEWQKVYRDAWDLYLPRENPLVFYPRRVREVLETHIKLAAFYLYLHRIRRGVERDPSPYIDRALAPVDTQRVIPGAPRGDENAIAGVAA